VCGISELSLSSTFDTNVFYDHDIFVCVCFDVMYSGEYNVFWCYFEGGGGGGGGGGVTGEDLGINFRDCRFMEAKLYEFIIIHIYNTLQYTIILHKTVACNLLTTWIVYSTNQARCRVGAWFTQYYSSSQVVSSVVWS
jgi:hypothetical protein